jgi:hypothetical protein
MKEKGMKETYEVPRIAVRGIVLEESLAVRSPVKKVELEAWQEISETSVEAESVSFQVW